MTGEELGVVLNLRATLSEYEHFMCELSAMIERGVDVPPCGVAKFPMREKLYAQVRDLVMGSRAIAVNDILEYGAEKLPSCDGTPHRLGRCFVSADPSFKVGDHVYLKANHGVKGVIRAFSDMGDRASLDMDSDGKARIFRLEELLHCDDGK